MKMLIISDIHGNWPALRAVLSAEPNFDQILCLGDLVNYGPMPVECVTWAGDAFASGIFLQGNHDYALGLNADPHCSPAYTALAAATQMFTSRLLTPELKRFLAGLKPLYHFQSQGAKCVACHARPKDPLCGYLPETASAALWESEVVAAGLPNMLFLGHTHLPMKTRFLNALLVNPGSVGQPKDGDTRAAYAVWEDGEVTLRRAAYHVEETVRAYVGLGLEPRIEHALCEVLRTGGNLPAEHHQQPKT
ncbi:MAG TPA: metallophosphoesterase family protein [Candidatus Aquilonibacter sp.]|nr:metallophosphoesterase family protein [Candidatus Aquilonibacter sp.]